MNEMVAGLVTMLAACVVLTVLVVRWAGGTATTEADMKTRATQPSTAMGSSAPPIRAATATPVVRLLSWNIHYGAGPNLSVGRAVAHRDMLHYLDGIATTIVQLQPDIVALQEVDRHAFRSHFVDQLNYIFTASGLSHAAWVSIWDARWVPYPGLDPRKHIGRVRSGLAVLSRQPLSSQLRIALPQPRHHTRLRNRFSHHRALQQVYVGGPMPLALLNVHLEAYDAATRHDQITVVLDHAKAHAATSPTVLLGDLNAVPNNALQKHGFADEPLSDLRHDHTYTAVIEAGLRDAVDGHRKNDSSFIPLTFPAHNPNRRLDHVFASAQIRARQAHVIGDPLYSDHLPVMVEITPG